MNEDYFVFEYEFLGFSKENISITCRGNCYTIKGTREKIDEWDRNSKNKILSFILTEGYFIRKCEMKNGVLRIHIEREQEREIKIPVE